MLTWNYRKRTVEKHPKNAKKAATYWKPKEYTEYRNVSQTGAQFLHLACDSYPCIPISHNTIVDLCCILALYKNHVGYFTVKKDLGLFTNYGYNYVKWRESLFGIMLSLANILLQTTHWGFSSPFYKTNVNPTSK